MEISPFTPPSPSNSRLLKAALAAAGLLLAAALISIAAPAPFTRFHADDFCIAGEVLQRGFFAAQPAWYLSWSGRYSATLVASLLSLAGPRSAALFTPLVMLVFLVGLWWNAKQLGERLKWPRPAYTAGLLALTALFALLGSLPNRYQSLFWLTGLATYTLPLALLSLAAGWVFFQLNRQEYEPNWRRLLAYGLLAFFSGGFSETLTAVQITLFGLATGAVWLRGSGRLRTALLPILAAWLAGSLAALGAMALAPGTAVRQAQLPETAGLLRILTFSLRNALHVAGKYLLQSPLAAAGSLLLPLVVGWLLPAQPAYPNGRRDLSLQSLWQRSSLKGIVLIPPASLALLAAACAPTVYAMNAYPDERAIVVPQFFLVLAVMAWGYLCGRLLRAAVARLPGEKWLAVLLAIALLAAAGGAAGQCVRQLAQQAPEARAYALRWDARHNLLRSARAEGALDLVVVSLESRFNLADLSADPAGWTNRCQARYYGFAALRGR